MFTVTAVKSGETFYLHTETDLNFRRHTKLTYEPFPMSERAALSVAKFASKDDQLTNIQVLTLST